MIDKRAVAAAGLFAACSALGAAISLQEDIPGEPLGIRVPGSVAVHLATGWGSALSAPAPMQVAAVVAAFSARPGLRWPARTLTGMGVAGLAGILVEPVTWACRPRSRAVAAMLPLEFASVLALIWAGRKIQQNEGTPRPTRAGIGGLRSNALHRGPKIGRWSGRTLG